MFEKIDLSEFRPFSFAIILIVLAATLFPGILFIYIFNEDLFFKLETIELLLLSVSITLPVLLLNSYLYLAYSFDFSGTISTEEMDRRFKIGAFFGGRYSIFMLYVTMAVGFFSKLSIIWGVIIMFGIELIFVVRLYIKNK